MEYLIFDADGEYVDTLSFDSNGEKEKYLNDHPGYFVDDDVTDVFDDVEDEYSDDAWDDDDEEYGTVDDDDDDDF